MEEKRLVWLHGEVKTPPFSLAARVETGILLRRLQRGEKLSLPHSRPMPAVGIACHELRVPDVTRSWRIMYHLSANAVIILAVWNKTTQQTPQPVLTACRQRLKWYLAELAGRED